MSALFFRFPSPLLLRGSPKLNWEAIDYFFFNHFLVGSFLDLLFERVPFFFPSSPNPGRRSD